MVYNLLMTTFYTRSGDDGFTGILGKGRLPKEHPVIEAVGAVDETTAALGIARVTCCQPHSKELLLAVQRDLYHLMSEVAATPEWPGWSKRLINSASRWTCLKSLLCRAIHQPERRWRWRVPSHGEPSGV
jgi:cob(I)alamin adenosyltransferase